MTTAGAVVATGDAAPKVEGSSAGGEPHSAVEGLHGKKHEHQHGEPLVVSAAECIPPTEQNKLTGKSEPKKRGRPPKRGKAAKTESKASKGTKKTPQKSQKGKSKVTKAGSPKAKAKSTKAKVKAASNRSKHAEAEATDEPIVEEETKVSNPPPKKKRKVASKASSSTEGDVCKGKSKRNAKRKVEAEGDGESKEDKDGLLQKKLEELPTVVRTKRLRKKTSEPNIVAPSNPEVSKASQGEEEKGTKSSEAKQRNARKSAAYRRASKKAKDAGKSPEECAAEGRKVFRLV